MISITGKKQYLKCIDDNGSTSVTKGKTYEVTAEPFVYGSQQYVNIIGDNGMNLHGMLASRFIAGDSPQQYKLKDFR